jgi:hypothetical protein
MWGHTECDDVMLFRIELEYSGVVALVAIEYQQSIFAVCTRRCMLVEVLDPI